MAGPVTLMHGPRFGRALAEIQFLPTASTAPTIKTLHLCSLETVKLWPVWRRDFKLIAWTGQHPIPQVESSFLTPNHDVRV